MSSEPVIDVERLLSPISEEQPTGEELSPSDFDGPFARIKDAWDDARKLIKEEQDREQCGGVDSMGEAWRTIPPPDWDVVIERSVEALENKSKDLRIAGWLAEALLRKHHIIGLRDGLVLCMGICERYWSDVRPAANDEDGHGVTVGGIASLLGDATFAAVLQAPIVAGQKQNEREERRYSAEHYLQAKELETLSDPEERKRRLENGQIEVPEFLAIAELTDPEFHRQNLEAIDQCMAKVNELGDFLRDNCRDDEYDEPTAPGVSSFREQLEIVRRLVVEFGGIGDQEESNDSSDDQQGNGFASSGKQDMTRVSAFQTIEEVAQFFERTEPHTPVHFALRQVVRWGKMPLPDLLAELIEDGGVMESLRRKIGLPEQEE